MIRFLFKNTYLVPFLSLLDLSVPLLQGRELRSSKAVLPLPSKVVTREHTHECVRGVASGSMPLWDPEMWGENSAVGSDSRHSKVHDQEVRDILPNP